ncbi:MAG: hypothetical protein HYU37_07485 [Acidobacteria bacterium]|nr:hypothetical protein [Acidobacteriota bacterium]
MKYSVYAVDALVTYPKASTVIADRHPSVASVPEREQIVAVVTVGGCVNGVDS